MFQRLFNLATQSPQIRRFGNQSIISDPRRFLLNAEQLELNHAVANLRTDFLFDVFSSVSDSHWHDPL